MALPGRFGRHTFALTVLRSHTGARRPLWRSPAAPAPERERSRTQTNAKGGLAPVATFYGPWWLS